MKNIFLTNYSKITFTNKIRESLKTCTSFYFSVSFIKKAGLVLILDDIKGALARGAVGKLITSTYQNFTDIPSLNEFLKLSIEFDNFSCRIDYNNFEDGGFHSKGYLFEYEDKNEVIVGSSNITRYALEKNIEWNMSLTSLDNEQYFNDAKNDFFDLWDKISNLDQDLINKYSLQIEYAIERWDMDVVDFSNRKIMPNYMQRKALKELAKYRSRGVTRALIIAATGSGKTYLAAFDSLNFAAKRLLFVVHRENILRESLKTFRNIFGNTRTYGLFAGGSRETYADFVFTTNVTMYRYLEEFRKDEFDYIIIDEVHHATAATYEKIIKYFEPLFLLGLTATPERMDEPESVIELFEQNVPYELRLRDALEHGLIVPFKYYGIKNDNLDYSIEDVRQLVNEMSKEENCLFIQENIEKYRHQVNGKLKAIGFCRNVEHSRLMAENMESLGYNTLSLTGNNSVAERVQAFENLQDENYPLEIIFTVDILNEGVDIPGINMVLFLRPTESSTIFIQQLGRGLRLYENKEHLVVLDFIGNSYTRSVQIAIALGTLSNNIQVDKRMLANFIREDFKQLNLPVEIHLDELSKEEILRSIERTNFNSLAFLKQDYHNFKSYLKNRTYLKHMDYIHTDADVDLLRYIKKYGSYYEFLIKVEDDTPSFDEKQIRFLRYLSSFLPLVRPYEYLVINQILDSEKKYEEIKAEIELIENFDSNKLEHALNNLQNLYYSDKQRELMTKYVEFSNSAYKIINLELNNTFKEHVSDLLEYGLTKFDIDFYNVDGDLNLYYTYDRASLLLALSNHTFASREGLIWKDNDLYIFIDLKKDQSRDEWLIFDNKFKSDKVLQWESSTNTTFENSKGKRLLDQERVHVFVRKIKKEDGITMPYIYLGAGDLTKPRTSNNIKNTLLFEVVLENRVPDYLKYDFEIEAEKDE